MYKKSVAISLALVSVVPSFAATIQLTIISTVEKTLAKAGTVQDAFSRRGTAGHYFSSSSSTVGGQSAHGEISSSVITGLDTFTASNYAVAETEIFGKGTAKAQGIAYTRINFRVLEEAVVYYDMSADSRMSSGTANQAKVRLYGDARSGGRDFVTALAGEDLRGSVLLGVGNYSVEIYSKAGISAKNRTASSYSIGSSYSSSYFSMRAEAVPEPVSMIASAAGAVTLLRRRRK
jgi:hypothetical protein